jgi:hypothetical protein
MAFPSKGIRIADADAIRAVPIACRHIKKPPMADGFFQEENKTDLLSEIVNAVIINFFAAGVNSFYLKIVILF